MSWQPILQGERLRLRPLRLDDFDALFAAASDPKIWELHPDPLRYTRERFQVYFDSGIASGGGLVVEHEGAIIGSSRFNEPSAEQVEIGYTFLTRPFWGGSHNREMKTLMLAHAFQYVPRVIFKVGKDNARSRRAMQKIGGELYGADATHVFFKIDRATSR